ncbi:MAG: hypothetical protein LUC44_07500, partial [Prevotellaceae bacterium]|nr:hypothetical protein [Prevotellaceae bacterium]
NSELDDLVSSINEIQDGFRRINEAEGRVTIANSSPESTSTKETIRENIAYIQDAMEKNREMIAQLQQKLKASTFNVSSLEKTLESLQQQMDEKDASIQELRAAIMEKDSLILAQDNKINDLNSDVSALSADNKQKAATVASQDKELNKAWFVFGTKAELKEQKILANNDVLRSDDFNRNYFTEVDIRTLKEINLYSKKAELLTSHPEGSYTLKKNQSGEYVLTVTNAKKFWSVSRYLVVLVK